MVRNLDKHLKFFTHALAVLAISLNSVPPANAGPQQIPPIYAQLAVVKPVINCAAIANADLSGEVGAAVTVKAGVIDTPKGQFCQIKGTITPSIGFEVDLPVATWTQRYLQAGCGGLCGSINASIGNAGTCRPALSGEFAVAATDMGHTGKMGSPDEGAFVADPQKRIDFAYRANHVTALAAKALIRTYYGVPPRYSYFSGCSDGGREALMEAQRYPDDFDGVSAGAPAMLFQIQNSFFHAWSVAANLRPDGSPILLAGKLSVLHAAVLAHCDLLDGIKDGLLSDPRVCHVQQSWVACKAGTTDTSTCLTAEEWAVAAKQYEGPTDNVGRHFLPGGLEPGSELMWTSFIPTRAGDKIMSAGLFQSMIPVVNLDPTAIESRLTTFPFTVEEFARLRDLHSLNDATNPDLRAFAARGGKLILWHGWADFSIAPMISVAYYRSVQARMGAMATDKFLRLFMLPGVGHCGGGDGFAQVDTLSPLMTWVEAGQKPKALIAEQIAEKPMGNPQGGSDGRGGGMHELANRPPLALTNQPALASRPIYPFPMIAHYGGHDDPKQASSYVPAHSPVTKAVDWYGASMLSPGFQRGYQVKDGKLAVLAP